MFQSSRCQTPSQKLVEPLWSARSPRRFWGPAGPGPRPDPPGVGGTGGGPRGGHGAKPQKQPFSGPVRGLPGSKARTVVNCGSRGSGSGESSSWMGWFWAMFVEAQIWAGICGMIRGRLHIWQKELVLLVVV